MHIVSLFYYLNLPKILRHFAFWSFICVNINIELPFLLLQSRTDRIIFKLFGKEPNDCPLVLRAQVHKIYCITAISWDFISNILIM